MRKLNVQIDDDLHQEVLTHIPWGQRRHVVSALLRLAVDIAKTDGHLAIGAIIDGKYKIVIRNTNV